MVIRKLNKTYFAFLAIILLIFSFSFLTSCGPEQSSFVIVFNGNGGVFSDGKPTYSVSLKQGESITLPQAPTRDGYVFIGWYLSANFKDIDKLDINKFKVLENRTIFAMWENIEAYLHSISVTGYEQGIITSNISQAKKGTKVTIDVSILDNAYCLREGSLKANDIVINTSVFPYVFEMPAENVVITAIFELRLFNIEILDASEPGASGAIFTEKNYATSGERVSIFAIPNFGFKLESIINYNNQEIIEGNSFIMPPRDINIGVKFSPIEYHKAFPINIEIDSPYLTVLPSKTFAATGEYITLEIDVSPSYYIKSLFINGDIIQNFGFHMPNANAKITAVVDKIDSNIKHSLTILQQPALDKTYVSTINDITIYSAGEKINLDLSRLDGYFINSILLNEEIKGLENLIMPDENATLTVNLEKANHKIHYFEDSQSYLDLSHLSAKEGEVIKIDLYAYYQEKKVKYKYWEYPNGEVIEEFEEREYFIMPGHDIYFSVEVIEDVSFEYQVAGEFLPGGEIALDKSKAQKDTLITVFVTCEEGYGLSGLYYMDAQSRIDIIPRYNYIEYELIKFLMPDYPIIVYAEFDNCYNILSLEDDKLIMYPSKKRAFSDEVVSIDVCSINNTNIIKYSFTVNEIEVSNLTRFNVSIENEDVKLGYKTIASSVSYNITHTTTPGGKISVPSSGVFGKLIPLKISPEKDYKLSSLTMRKSSEPNSQGEEIADTFLMPEYNITITAVFSKLMTESVSIKDIYLNNKDYYISTLNIFTRYLEGYNELKELFSSHERILTLVQNIHGVLIVDCPFRLPFYIFQLKDPLLLNTFTQVVHKDFQEKNNAKVDVSILDKHVVVSIGGWAVEDYYAAKQGLFLYDNKYLLYTNVSGTYSLYKYLDKGSPYVVIPSFIKINAENKRIIEHICSRAFEQSSINGLYLSNVRSLGRNAFSSLNLLSSLDLSNIISLEKDSLLGLIGIIHYYVATNNDKYSIDDKGVLYSKDKKEIISYPKGKKGESYELARNCTNIGDYCFANAVNLEVIMTPLTNKIINLGDFCFFNCDKLKYIGPKDSYETGFAKFDLMCANDYSIGENALSLGQFLNNVSLGNPNKILKHGIVCLEETSIDISIDMSKVSRVISSIPFPIYIPKDNCNVTIHLSSNMIDSYRSHYIWKEYSMFYSIE